MTDAHVIDLTGQVALVTGSSRGLGRAHALTLAAAGADVIIHDIREQAAAEFGEARSGSAVGEEIVALGRRSGFLAADLTAPDQVAALVERAVALFGKIDILVNNAGGDIGAHTPRPDPNNALDIHDDDIHAVVDRNLLTTMFMCKYVGRHMRERRSGKIVNIGSGVGHIPTEIGLIYASAKAGVSHYTRCLGEEMRPHGVNVNCLSPSPTATGRFLATRSLPNQDHLSHLQRVNQPEDMARLVLFLASALSDVLTGETIVCWY